MAGDDDPFPCPVGTTISPSIAGRAITNFVSSCVCCCSVVIVSLPATTSTERRCRPCKSRRFSANHLHTSSSPTSESRPPTRSQQLGAMTPLTSSIPPNTVLHVSSSCNPSPSCHCLSWLTMCLPVGKHVLPRSPGKKDFNR